MYIYTDKSRIDLDSVSIQHGYVDSQMDGNQSRSNGFQASRLVNNHTYCQL